VNPTNPSNIPVFSSHGYSQRRVMLIVLILAIAAFMQMLDSAVLAIAIPAMAKDFGAPPTALGLGITVYVLAAAIMIPTSGWIADRFGARRVFVCALIAFTIASVLCGFSRTLEQFVAARVLQGITGALLSPVGSVIMMSIVERRDMIRMTNLFTAPMLMAPVIGPPLGGFITTWFGWPWIFYLNIPFGVAGVVLATVFITELGRRRRPFDTLGLVLNGLTFAALIYGFDRLAEDRAALTMASGLILVGVALGWIAVRHSLRHPHPLLSLTPLRFASFRLTSIGALPFMRLPSAALPFIVPILLQVGFGLSAFATGMLFLGYTSGDLLMKAFTSRAFRCFGYRATMQVAMLGVVVSLFACALFTSGTPYWLMLVVLFIGGCFRSFTMTALGTLSYAEIPPAELTSATILNQVMMQLSQAVGVSFTVLVLQLAITGRGEATDRVSAIDCRIALALVGIVTAIALLPIRRLAPDAGSELSGHRPGLGEALSD